MNTIDKIGNSWQKKIIESDASAHGWFMRSIFFWVRLIYGIVLKFGDRQIHMQSASLAYTTLLSLVPLLAVTFSVLKGFGVQNQLEPMLMQSLEPLGDKGVEIGQNILLYVNNLNFAVLGFMGIALLFWTVISLLQRVEEAFNAIWRVRRIRSLGRRFSDYLSVTLVGPVFIVTALGLNTLALHNGTIQRISAIEPFGRVILGLGSLVPYLLVCGAFAFLYAFLANIRVRLIPALAGGIFASVAWYGVGHVFAELVANSSKYSAIYSSLAAVILFIIWINVGWLIVLVGAHIAHYVQNPQLLRHLDPGAGCEGGYGEGLALGIMMFVGRAFYFDASKWSLAALMEQGGGASLDQIEGVIRSLTDRHLLVATNEEPLTYVPGRAIETILLTDILAAARAQNEGAARPAEVQAVVTRIDDAISDSLKGQTLRDLVLANVSLPSLRDARATPGDVGAAAMKDVASSDS